MSQLSDERRLHAVAYRLLGSVADAEDVVQQARCRLLELAGAPHNEAAYLFRVVTNLALDRLRERRRRAEAYVGPWLPEPVLTEAVTHTDGEAVVGLAEDLSLGLLLMLERLSPAERVVFVLREAFDHSFTDIAKIVDSSAPACRQRYRRAKANLARERRYVTRAAEQQTLINGLLLALAQRDEAALLAMFSSDSIVRSDGGGVVSAAIRPVTGPGRIAQVLLHLSGKPSTAELQIARLAVNGGVGIVLHEQGTPHSCIQVEGANAIITRLYIMRNPQKMRHLAAHLAGNLAAN